MLLPDKISNSPSTKSNIFSTLAREIYLPQEQLIKKYKGYHLIGAFVDPKTQMTRTFELYSIIFCKNGFNLDRFFDLIQKRKKEEKLKQSEIKRIREFEYIVKAQRDSQQNILNILQLEQHNRVID